MSPGRLTPRTLAGSTVRALDEGPLARKDMSPRKMANMNLIPKQLVVGLFTPFGLPGTVDQLTSEKINRAWAELASRHGYTQLQLSPDGAAANFLGATTDDGITIQPPVLQFRTSVRTTVEQAGDSAQDALKTLSRHLGARSFQQLGIKVIYWAVAPDNDGAAFVLNRVFARSDDALATLRGAGTLMAGAKFIVQEPKSVHTILVEPLVRDPKYLYLEVDTQFGGAADLDLIGARVKEVDLFLTRTLAGYLQGLAPGA